MTIFYDARKDGYRYNFTLYKTRYQAPRVFRTKAMAEAAERALRDRLMGDAAGIPRPRTGPLFWRWADTTYRYAVERKRLRDPATFDRRLKTILQFWGKAPDDPAKVVSSAPYHDLTLDVPIRDGDWLLKFEEWMSRLGLAGSTKNHYRSACSRLYAVAMLPEYRQQTGILINPFRGMPRDQTRRRETVFSRDEIAQLLAVSGPALQLAIRIALLAPELRLGNILALRWTQIDDDLRWIRMAEHKTAGRTGRPLVTPIVTDLRRTLVHERQNAPRGCKWVVHEHGAYLSAKQLQHQFRAAVEAIGLSYGLQPGGVTFHSLRHTAATNMAEIGISEAQRKEAIGHLAIQTTQGYTHLAPGHKIAPLEQHAKSLRRFLSAAGRA